MLKTKDIVFICDDNYCMPTAVCIQSIIDNLNTIEDAITIHVCTFNLNTYNVSLLQNLSCGLVTVVVNFFDAKSYKERIESISQKSHVTPTALIKFELANYFSGLDYLLYLDSDMIVKGDLSELLNIDLGKSYIGASYEFYDHINRISYSLKRSVSKVFYFNSGLMLLNLKAMRQNNIPEQLWYYKLNKAKTTLMDQESLNAICSSGTLHLPIKWNFNPIFLQDSFLNEINKVYGTNYSDTKQLENDAAIIHYVGSTDKPWNYKTARLRSYWDKYYRIIFKEIPLNFKEIEEIKRSKIEALRDKLHKHGLWGLFCNLIYLFNQKDKNA